MNTARSTYQVHAELVGTGSASAALDGDQAGHPLARRLNRLQRVAAVHQGQTGSLFNNGLQVAFETADAALLGTCEMQHRCAVLPQVYGNRLALRIGIHQGIVRQRSSDGTNDARDFASLLAVADDGIVASGIVVAALSCELRKLTSPLNDLPAELAAHKVDWRCVMPPSAHGGESIWPASKDFRPISPYLLLHYELKTFELTREHPLTTVGREPQNDLRLAGDHISRHHCRIERRTDGIILTDSSTNGTFVLPEEGKAILLRNASIVLRGKGMLYFGRPCNGERRGGARYEAY